MTEDMKLFTTPSCLWLSCSYSSWAWAQECKISKSFGSNETQVLYTFDDKSQPLDYNSLATNLQSQLSSMMTGYSTQQEVPAAATPTVSITIPTVSSVPATPAATSAPSSAAATAATGGTATGQSSTTCTDRCHKYGNPCLPPAVSSESTLKMRLQ